MRAFRSKFFEADPIQAGLQVDFEQREADPLRYSMPTHNIHPASELDPGADDGTSAPYDGAMMPGQEGQEGLPPGGAMPMQDEQMSPIGPGSGTRQPPPSPGMQESMDLDLLLDDILNEAPGDNSAADLNRQQLGLMAQHGAGQNFAPSMYQAPNPQMQQRWNDAPAQTGMTTPRTPMAAAQQARPTMPNAAKTPSLPRSSSPRANNGPAMPPAGGAPARPAAIPPAGAGGMGQPSPMGQASSAGSADRVADRYASAPGPSQRGAAPSSSADSPSPGTHWGATTGLSYTPRQNFTAAPNKNWSHSAQAATAPAAAGPAGQASPAGAADRVADRSGSPSTTMTLGGEQSTEKPPPISQALNAAGTAGGAAGGLMMSADWGLNWDDYDILHESDRTKERQIRGY